LSIELPEAQIFAEQMDAELKGKKIESYDLRDYKRMQRIGFINKDLTTYQLLVGRTVESVSSSGNTIRVKLDKEMNLLIAPEYGGKILYQRAGDKVPKYHLRVDFTDGTHLTTRLTSMGLIYAVADADLKTSYMYNRDFLGKPSPLSEEFTYERFKEQVEDQNRQLKPLLVGKEAVVVGLSNSAYQDIIYRAGLHPKRKASSLSQEELQALYDNMRHVLNERLRLGGKDQFTDLYEKKGGYTPAMGPNMKAEECPKCGSSIQKLAHGGGHIYLCPTCQKE
jgi:formamidopyrimidine-DNA glycosylase